MLLHSTFYYMFLAGNEGYNRCKKVTNSGSINESTWIVCMGLDVSSDS